jgi:prepilin-type N-terminal cleavage/methylation domain-containing protein
MMRTDSLQRLRNRSGFTLIELLVSLVIVAILASISLSQYQNITDKARVAAAEYELNQCMRGLWFYQASNDTQAFPITSMITSYDDLNQIVGPHLGALPDETTAKFTFVSYTADDTSFTIVGTARDRGRSTLTGTNMGITITP